MAISGLLAQPGPAHGLNEEALNLYNNNRKEYERIAKEWTKKYAIVDMAGY